MLLAHLLLFAEDLKLLAVVVHRHAHGVLVFHVLCGQGKQAGSWGGSVYARTRPAYETHVLLFVQVPKVQCTLRV